MVRALSARPECAVMISGIKTFSVNAVVMLFVLGLLSGVMYFLYVNFPAAEPERQVDRRETAPTPRGAAALFNTNPATATPGFGLKSALPVTTSLPGPTRCHDGVWGLPTRADGFRITAHFGYKSAESSYSKGLIERGAVSPDVSGIFHSGIDLAADTGDPIYAVTSGTVLKVGYTDQYGKYIVIQDETHEVLFGHLSQAMVVEGERIACGQLIGLAGGTGKATTGPHLHLELRLARNDKPLDPRKSIHAAQKAASPTVR
jgi:murein DD-endopeptidase MepM/ murein hydrolase activator NlpD